MINFPPWSSFPSFSWISLFLLRIFVFIFAIWSIFPFLPKDLRVSTRVLQIRAFCWIFHAFQSKEDQGCYCLLSLLPQGFRHLARADKSLGFWSFPHSTKSKEKDKWPRAVHSLRIYPIPHSLAWSETMVSIPPWAQKTLEIKGFAGLERLFLNLVSQTPRPRG